MAAPINIPVNVQLQNVSQLQRQIQQATQNIRINLVNNNSARSLTALSQPLGRLTGQADEFTKSMDAANARVLAFGASVGVVNAFSNAFKSLIASTIEVEKALKAITVVGDQFAGSTKELGQGLFNVAKLTGQSFAEVSKAALEFSRQGLKLEDTLQRTQDALILTRLTGLDSAKAVDGLTAAFNAFSKAGLSTSQILNKLAAVDQAFAVSSADLIEGFNRSAAVAQNAGVTFDELAGIITALQQETSRGGAVIGNALKTIFTRIQDKDTLVKLKELGITVEDVQGKILPARQILQNLAQDVQGLGQVTKSGIFKDVAGAFQINQLISLVGDLNKQNGIAASATEKSAKATNEAYIANEKLNQSLDAILNKVAVSGKQIGSILGDLGISDNLKGLLDGLNSFLESASSVLQGDDIGAKFAQGLVKGIGSVLTGPGVGLFLAIIAKLSYDLIKFGAQGLKTFFNIGQAAKQQQQIQESIVQTLLRNQNVLSQIVNTQGGQNAQAQAFLNILRQEEQTLQNIRTLAGGIAAPVIAAGYRTGNQGLQRGGSAAAGYLPAQEASDVRRGVGGASPSSKVVAIPNFAFGGGKRGTMIANTSEYIVPNYAGGGSAIFNQDMAKTMGLPPGAKKISAAGGFVPNFRGIKGLAGRNIPFNSSKYIEEQYITDLKNSKAPVILAGRLFEALARGDKFIDLTENKQLADIDKGPYKISEAKLSVDAGLRDPSLGIGKPKGNKLLVPLSALSSQEQIDRLKNRGIELTKHKKLTHSILFAKSREIIDQYKNKNDVPNKIKIASKGYVPNFANYIFDSDRLGNSSRKILDAILASPAKKNLLSAPSGAGKSTYAGSMGKFIKSLSDVLNASENDYFTILSGAGLTKAGGMSADFSDILASVNKSGGKVNYLGVPNSEIMSRRSARSALEGDVRSAAELAGTVNAPLNQSSFIKNLKKGSKNFEMIRESKSNQDLAVLGLYGENGVINGSPVYTLKSQRPNLFKDIKANLQKNVVNLVRGYAERISKSIGVPVVQKDVKKSLNQIPSLSGFMFEDILNQLAGPNFDSNKISGGSRVDFPLNDELKRVFGVSGSQKYAEIKLNPFSADSITSILAKQKALASGTIAPKEFDPMQIAKWKETAIGIKLGIGGRPPRGAPEKRNQLVKEMIEAGAIQSYAGQDAETAAIKKFLGLASGGYIPNFASTALQAAISRERSAGVPASQIYVDQSPALQSSANPMGLMVANRRDEPAGGFQGISRARKEGRNPKTYGAANGFVPNFFAPGPWSQAPTNNAPANSSSSSSPPAAPNPANIEAVNKGFADTAGKIFLLQSAMSFLNGALGEADTSLGRFTQELSNTSANITSLALFGKEIAGIKIDGDGLGAKFGRFAKNLGLVGVGFAAVTEGFKLVDFAFKEFSGANKRAADALAGLETAAQGALISLNDLTPTGQRAAQESGEAALEIFNASFLNLLSDNANKNPEIQKQASLLNAQGFDRVLLRKMIEDKTLEIAAQEQGYKSAAEYTKTELEKASGTEATATPLTDLVTRETLSKALNALFTSPEVLASGRALASVKAGFESGKFGAGTTATEIKNNSGIEGIDKVDINVLESLVAAQKLLASRKADTVKLQKEEALGEKVSLELQKQKIDALIEQKKLQIDLNAEKGSESLRLELETLDASETYKNNLQKKIALQKIDSDLLKTNLDILKSSIDQLTSLPSDNALGISSQQAEKIGNALKGLDIQTVDQLKEKITEIGGELGLLPAQLEKTIALFADKFNYAKKTADAQKEAAKYTADFNAKVIGVKNALQDTKLLTEQIANNLERAAGVRLSFAEVGISQKENEAKLLRSRASVTTTDSEKRSLEARAIQLEKEVNELRRKSSEDQYDTGRRILVDKKNEAQKVLDKKLSDLRQGKIRTTEAVSAQEALNKAEEDLIKFDNAQTIARENFKLTNQELNNQAEGIYRLTGAYDALKNSLDQFQRSAGERIGGAMFEQLGATDIDSLIKARIKEKVETQAQGGDLNNADYYKSVQEGVRLGELRYEQAVAESEVRRRELDYEIKYTEELIALKKKGATEEELIAAKKRQIEEQRSGKRGLERGLDAVQDKINNYRTTFAEEIPQLFSSNLAQGLNDAISGAKSLKDALRDAATSFLNAITQKNIENLANLFTSGIGGAGKALFKANGGMISGGSGTKDDVPAMLMGGEYVIKKSAVKKYGSRFLDSLNNGGVQAFAAGGGVQSGKGGFYVPGDFGEGAITGKNQLLTFAGQSFTGGQYDRMGGFGMSGASISLEPESARLTAYGRENSPIFERVQQAKEEAFNVYLDQLKQESAYQQQLKEIDKAEKERKKQLTRAIVSAVVSSAVSYAGSSMAAGAKNANAAAIASGGKSSFMTGLKGAFTGYKGQGGLGNIFGSNALTLSSDTKFLNSIGVNSSKDLSKLSSESYGKLFNQYPNLGKTYNFDYNTRTYIPSGRAFGGLISGGSGMRDDVPAMLTGGEFVLNNRATRKLGVQNLNRLNAGATESQQSSGGVSDALISKLDELIQTTRESSKDNVVVNVSGMETGGEKRSDENKSSNDRELQRKIREAVLAVIAQEKRLGGSLNK